MNTLPLPPERILIIGSTGLLGQAFVKKAQHKKLAYLGVATNTTPSVDVTQPETLQAVIESFRPTVVINTAAIVNLAECKANPAKARKINAKPAEYLAQWAEQYEFYNIHISTDHYYTGDGNATHSENAPITLLNEYAASKYAGEQYALTHPNSLVVRTNIVGFRGKVNQPTFVEWAIETLEHQRPLTLFHDFYTSSIDVTHFVGLLFQLLPQRPSGLLNLASSTVTSKQTFVTALAKQLNLNAEYAEIGSVLSPHSLIQRAESLGLDVTRAEALLNQAMPTLDDVITQLVTEYHQQGASSDANPAPV